MKAAKLGNYDIVNLLLENDADLDQVDHQDRTALITTIVYYSKHVEVIVYLLLKYGANVNKVDNEDCSALLYAVVRNKYNIVDMLLKNGADDKDDALNQTLSESNNSMMLDLLLEHGANIDHVDEEGDTILMNAVFHNNILISRKLLNYRNNVNSVNNKRETALMLAVKQNNIDMVDLLLRYKANVEILNKKNFTALMIAAKKAQNPIVERLLNSGKITIKDKNRALEVAIENKNESTVELIKNISQCL